ncbi:MAG TPA: ATP-binding protein [Candidatus Polarisedimenticolia bacterium]|nr:ATP-binding protein [Candidatus Polarisedimenticolia bacterium]
MSRPIVRLEIATREGLTRIVPVERTPFAIGSDPSSDLSIAGAGIAPHHVTIVLLGGAYHLVPEPAAPPVHLNGAPLPTGGAPLGHGARIDLGASAPSTLRFLIEEARGQDRGDRLITLMEIARTITASLALDEVLDRVLEGAVRFSGAERGYLFLSDSDRLIPWTRGTGETPSGVQVSLSVAEEVARSGRPIYRDRLTDESGRPVTESIARLRLQAILCLPLAVRGDVIGVVYLDSKRHLPHHQPDLPLLEALAGLAAIAIQNTRLVEERLRSERTLVIGQMARAIVHDLRSPLTSIRGLAELLLERSPEGEPARPHLATIIAEADRLSGLTGDLLQFSREAPPLQRAPVKITELVRQTVTPLEPRLQQGGVRLALDLDEKAYVSVDAPRMLRALHNLLANSLDALRGGGGSIDIRCQRRESCWRLSLRDSGCGMPEEVRRRVFEPFFSHGKPNGTGLGMAIVRKIIEEHGGTIRVDSSPGLGTTVLLDLPAAA